MSGHTESILQKGVRKTDRYSFLSGSRTGLEKHHIYFGSGKRKISDKHGFWVWLTAAEHRGINGVHGKNGHDLDRKLKRLCQRKFEETHSREEFMEIIGKNYLWEEEE